MIDSTRNQQMVSQTPLLSLFLSMLVILIVVASACTSGTPPGEEPTAVTQKSDLDYLVTVDDDNDVKVSGGVFEVSTNNCGSRVSAFESYTRSREFDVTLNAEISETLQGQLGGDLLVAEGEIGAAIGAKLGVQIGSKESVQTQRQIETPADSITTATLQWEEIWQTGNITLNRADSTKLGDVPFRVLTTMRLSQIGIQDIPCGTLVVQEPESNSLGSINETDSKEVPPKPTNTPSPTSTPRPRPTNTPMGMASEIHEIESNIFGSSLNTRIYIQAGDLVNIAYLSGEWWIGQSTNNSCNGYGDEQTSTNADGYLDREGDRVESLILCDNPNICRPLTSAPWGSLIGYIGESGGLIHIGSQKEFVAQDSGILYLRMNYYNHNNETGCPYGNGGSITVRVNVTPP